MRYQPVPRMCCDCQYDTISFHGDCADNPDCPYMNPDGSCWQPGYPEDDEEGNEDEEE